MSISTATTEEISEQVRAQVGAALGLAPDEINFSDTLLGDLGAESLDLLDMLFRIEKKTGVKLALADIITSLQGELSNEEFVDADGYVTAAGLDQLKKALPQINPDDLAGTLESGSIFSLYTVQNLADLVIKQSTK